MSTLHSMSTARAMATICCTAMEQLLSCWVGLTGMSSERRISPARRLMAPQLTPAPLVRAINMFSATVRLGQRVISWYTVLMPTFWAS